MTDAYETLRAVREQITAVRMAARDTPAKIRLHPWSYENLVLDDHLTRYQSLPSYLDWQNLRLFGIPVVEDRRLPEDVIVLEGPRGRVTLLRRVETTQYRAIVRDGVRRAHPWLRLPEPVPPAEGARWATWVFEDPNRWYWRPPSHALDARIYSLPVYRPDSFARGSWA